MQRFAALAISLATILMAACQAAEAQPSPTDRPPSSTPHTGLPSPEPTTIAPTEAPPGLSGPTGIGALDRTIHTVAAGNLAAIQRRVELTPIPCGPARQGPGSAPACAPGQAPGTPVQALPYATCSDQFATGPAVSAVIEGAFSTPVQLHGAVTIRPGGAFGYWPGEEYGVIYGHRETGAGFVAVVNADGAIRRIHSECTSSAAELLELAGSDSVIWAAAFS